MKRVITVDIDNAYWREFKKSCVELDISMAKRVERFIYQETDKYINAQIKKETETENEINETS
jgi:hypothetical protein